MALDQLPAASSRNRGRHRGVFYHLLHLLDRQQLRPRIGKAWLSAVLAAAALAPLWRLLSLWSSAQDYDMIGMLALR